MTRTIYLHGFLGKKYGKTHKINGSNMFQVMRALTSICGAQFKSDIAKHEWHLVEGKVKKKNDIGEEDLNRQLHDKELHILPAVIGHSAALRIVVGIVLVIIGAMGATWGWWAGGSVWGPMLMGMGMSMILGGVTELMTHTPKVNSNGGPDQKSSFVYNGATNVTSQGGPVPLLYGRVPSASSVVISTDFSSDKVI